MYEEEKNHKQIKITLLAVNEINRVHVTGKENIKMAAGKCKAAYHTDEWHGYRCSITDGACMFLYPDSKACAEQYGEGPDSAGEEAEEGE